VEHVPPCALLHVVLIVSDNYRLRLPAGTSPRGWEFGWVGYVKTSEQTGNHNPQISYRGADKSLARPGRKQATATEDFEFHTSYL
jgi:hypothetical protein